MKHSLSKKTSRLLLNLIFTLTCTLTMLAFSLSVGAEDILPNTVVMEKHIIYTVREGNTLAILAENFGTSVDNIKTINNLPSNIIHVGQTLKMPANYIDYTVKPGDYLALIAQKFGTSVTRIRFFNNLYTNLINVGQVLHIPNVTTVPYITNITHTVIAGDNIWNLSLKYGIPQAELARANGLTMSSTLSIGQKLKIPVYTIPVTATPGPKYGEYLDWWKQAQYLFPIGDTATIRDFKTGITFNVKRTIGANHADCEPLTSADAETMLKLWNGNYSWATRAVTIEDEGRKIAASVTSMPHGVQYIENNNFNGHFDIHFKNSTRHKDGEIDPYHQTKIKIAAGVAP